jgi:hypothetical protein
VRRRHQRKCRADQVVEEAKEAVAGASGEEPQPAGGQVPGAQAGVAGESRREVNCPTRHAMPLPALSHAPQRGEMMTPPPLSADDYRPG